VRGSYTVKKIVLSLSGLGLAVLLFRWLGRHESRLDRWEFPNNDWMDTVQWDEGLWRATHAAG